MPSDPEERMPSDRLVKAMLFDNVLVASTGSAESGVMPMYRAVRAESLLIKATSATVASDVKIEYAVSHDGVEFGDYEDNDPLVASSALFETPEGLTAVTMPNMLSPYVKFKVTGIAANPADTRVTVRLVIREGY